jgi:hypothetical protein
VVNIVVALGLAILLFGNYRRLAVALHVEHRRRALEGAGD